ncbi:flagellar FliL protein [Jannaschia faecimaris]|uniref:Flagellar protein FliL n=1 Tax=Jannaschia faecimaris TaxID=1244108 RepID=A0A1H3JY17_9RHOB|nr:flagellar basal body-associated FliL family protein [Jannaschia faecimaris]SDY44847.1 flagellar FliL protein [Jannaschia faecimaris]
MADTDESASANDTTPKKGLGILGWSFTTLSALFLATAGFYASYSGVLGESGRIMNAANGSHSNPEKVPIFLELDPMMISVGDAGSIRQMRFRAFLQLEEGHRDVAALQPRILDIFSTYLRAVSVQKLEDPTALLDLRAQLLRRVQLLAGRDSVRDLLIIDFVIT